MAEHGSGAAPAVQVLAALPRLQHASSVDGVNPLVSWSILIGAPLSGGVALARQSISFVLVPAYAHEAVVKFASEADERAPGAAITVALCGHWEHDGPCRWPHHTAVAQTPKGSIVRTVFVAPEAEQAAVRTKIAIALSAGCLNGPERASEWSLISHAASEVAVDEQGRATRFLAQQQSP
jgi:hypothetical protein